MGASETAAGGGTSALEDAGSTAALFDEIERLTEANRSNRDVETERRLLRLRHRAGARLLGDHGRALDFPAPDTAALPAADGLPDINPRDVTPELLRAGILRDGCLLVRGLVDRDAALSFAAEIECAFEERDRKRAAEPGYYEPFHPDPPFQDPTREWIKEGGGVLAGDSPRLSFQMIELFRGAAVPELVAAYLGEPAAISLHKTTLRKAEPSVQGAWHQDGAFMGEVRSLNLWLSLSRCGDEAPGLDIVPRRLDELVATGTEGTFLPNQVSQALAEQAAGDSPIVRPVFEPGDAVLFDELCLHQTASDQRMPNPRYAIESWFFGRSAFPRQYAPIAI